MARWTARNIRGAYRRSDTNVDKWAIVLKKSGYGPEASGSWFALDRADRLRPVLGAPSAG